MFNKSYPGLAEWVDGWGWIEIGFDEHNRSLIRILDEGGMVWESLHTIKSLEKASLAADQFIDNWIKENG